ncbi:hypothetical protein ACQ4PT_014980 [Festuca glaucescens]
MVELIMATLFVVAAVVLYLMVEQLSYQRKKGPLPGPPLVVPFLGSVVQMVGNPTRFWEVKAAQSKESGLGLAADWLFGRFVIFIRDSELSHRVFANVRPDAFQFMGHPFGNKLWGPDNIIYKFDDEHKEVRRRIAPNFTVHALSTYAAIQQRVILAHLQRWLDQSAAAGMATAMPLRVPVRGMNLETSQTVFVGPYLTEETREILSKDYSIFIGGILAIPVDLLGLPSDERGWPGCGSGVAKQGSPVRKCGAALTATQRQWLRVWVSSRGLGLARRSVRAILTK